jgi:hypothetical protein
MPSGCLLETTNVPEINLAFSSKQDAIHAIQHGF